MGQTSGHISRTFPKSNAELMASPTRRDLPRALDYGHASTTEYTQALDNFHRVFGIRQGDHVVMLTDPLLDPRVVQVVQGLAKARGATFISYMGESTRYVTVPDEAKARLAMLDTNGPGPEAFTFRQSSPPPTAAKAAS